MANETTEQQLIEQRKARARRVAREVSEPNPLYGTDVFEPDAYVATQFSDPIASQPLPSGRFIDTRYPSNLSRERAAQISEFQNAPEEYVKENSRYQVNEQSLIDRGKSMLSRVFDYRDDPDLSLFNVNISAVESVWDGFLRYMTGGYDLLNVGLGGLVSAAPGGIRTLEFSELTGNRDIGQVLSGEMEPGDAPSVGQIAITSIGLESKRIREGNARLTDLALLSPATAPFIMSGILAESSPVQADNFDIMNREQREAAFSNGWERWMSGITDFGFMFADPLIGAGLALKVARSGAMGLRGPLRTSKMYSAFSQETLDQMTTVAFNDARPIREITDEYLAQQQAVLAPGLGKSVSGIVSLPPQIDPKPFQVTTDMAKPKDLNWLGSLYWDIATKDAQSGVKKMTPDELALLPEIAKVPNKADIATLLHKADNPIEVGLVFEAAMGSRDAYNALNRAAPALADEIRRMEMTRIRALSASSEPAKLQDAKTALQRQLDILGQQANLRLKQIRDITNQDNPARVDLKRLTPQDADLYTKLRAEYDQLTNSRDAVSEMLAYAADGKIPDKLDPNSAFFNLDEADAILNDLWRRSGFVEEAARKDVYETLLQARMPMMTRNNAYTRMVAASRRRRGRAAYEYAVEGTNILPKRVPKVTSGSKPEYEWSWMAKSQFGTSRLQRSLRVWRWLGEETPSGWIGLKGTATVGSEREFRAATNLEVFRGDAIEVTYLKEEVVDGKVTMVPTTELFGGSQKRQELYQRFYEALNDPSIDNMRALEAIEDEIMETLGRVYGVDPKKMAEALAIANKRRAKSLDILRRRAYYVDDDGTVNTVPYLETHLQNGTYMQNFIDLEKDLKRASIDGRLATVQKTLDIPLGYAGSGYEIFQNFWRPATLLRLNYLQRNVFEGLLRSMAYSASLAPLTWPVRGTFFGVRNAIVKRVAEKSMKDVERRLSGTDFAEARENLRKAFAEEARMDSALELSGPDGPVFQVIQRGKNGEVVRRTLSETEYEAQKTAIREQVEQARLDLSSYTDQFEAAIAGTKFKKWRDAQLKDIRTEIMSARQSTEVMFEAHMDNVAVTGITDFDPQTLAQLADETELIAIKTQLETDLTTNPTVALALYRSQAGRQKRIGSGTTMAPDGNYYGDAFADPLQQINRSLLSADSTVKQALSLRAGAWFNLFQKQVIKENVPVPFTNTTRQQWLQAMARVIEDDSSSRIVRKLLDNDFDVQKTVAWLQSKDPQAQEFLQRVLPMMQGDVSMKAYLSPYTQSVISEKTRETMVRAGEGVPPFVSPTTLSTGGRVFEFDEQLLFNYVSETAEKVRTQMQNEPVFLELLRTRARQKASGVGPSGQLTPDDIEAALAQLTPESVAKLGSIQGAEIIQMGSDRMMGVYSKFIDSAFRWIGTIPEDALVRGPFYNMRFKAIRNDLIRKYWDEQGMADMVRASRSPARDSAGVAETMSIEHDAFKIPQKELSRIQELAHRQSLSDTREFLYTIERRTNLGKYGEYVFPFISATQNTVTTLGKLLWKEPWLAPFVATLWQAPTRLGLEDDEGNLLLPVPTEAVREFLQDRPDIPLVGGVIGPDDTLKLAKNSLNVWLPETGFGLVPRPGPIAVVTASELTKLGAFPVETPQPFKSALGETDGAQVYQYIKNWVFGEEQGASEVFLSADKVLPAWVQRITESRSEFSKEYGYQYAMQRARQWARYRAGEIDQMPTPEDIHKRTTNTFWFYVLGQQGIPNPLNPLPTLSRPTIATPTDVLVEQMRVYREKDPANALLNFSNDYGDWALDAAITNVSEDIGGAAPTAATVSDIKTLDPLIRKIAPMLNDNKDVLGILVNNRNSLVGQEPTLDQVYDPSAYAAQKAMTIGGTTETWRTVLGPAMSEAERQKIQGWTMHNQFFDIQEARLASRGLTSFEVAAAKDLKAANERFIANMRNNPEMAGWVVDYDDIGGNRVGSALFTIASAVEDPAFQKFMIQNGKEQTLACMNEYLMHRNAVLSLLAKSGAGIEDDKNWWIKQGWETVRLKLKQRDVRWADIANRYLANDDNPRPQLMPNNTNALAEGGM